MVIVDIRSRAFTGSTWFGYVLGSHEQAMFLGNPDRAWDLFSELGPRTCRVHYGQCEFWPRVSALHPTKQTFLAAIRDVAGCDELVVYNVGAGVFQEQIDAGDHGERVEVEIVRDVAERFASWKRRNEGTVIDAVRGSFGQPTQQVSDAHSRSAHGRRVTLRHEVLASDGAAVVAAASDITGLAFDASALTYWRHRHHPAHGNGVTHATCRHFQNPPADSSLDPIYLQYLERLDAGVPHHFVDNRPVDEVSDYERFVLDQFVGDANAEQGYKRPEFSEADTARHSARLQIELEASAS